MKLSDFMLLNADQKAMTVLHDAVLVGKRKDLGSMIFLFRLSDYYVETYCSLQTKQVEEFRVFDTQASLNPYLDSIDIGGLLC